MSPRTLAERHEPELYRTGRHGSWCHCSCGWRSGAVSGGAMAVSRMWAAHLARELAP